MPTDVLEWPDGAGDAGNPADAGTTSTVGDDGIIESIDNSQPLITQPSGDGEVASFQDLPPLSPAQQQAPGGGDDWSRHAEASSQPPPSLPASPSSSPPSQRPHLSTIVNGQPASLRHKSPQKPSEKECSAQTPLTDNKKSKPRGVMFNSADEHHGIDYPHVTAEGVKVPAIPPTEIPRPSDSVSVDLGSISSLLDATGDIMERHRGPLGGVLSEEIIVPAHVENAIMGGGGGGGGGLSLLAESCDWVCACGQSVKANKRRCGNCNKWRGGKKPTMRKRKPEKELKRKRGRPKNALPLSIQSPTVAVDATKRGANDISPLTGIADEASLSSMSTTATINDEHIVDMMEKSAAETGDGGESDCEGGGMDVTDLFVHALHDSELDKGFGEHSALEDAVDHTDLNESELQEDANAERRLDGAPDGWAPPGPPEDFQIPQRKVGSGEPSWENVDNPGNWHPYVFRAKHLKTKYIGHEMPGGARPVPPDKSTGKRIEGGYHFFYNGWKMPEYLQTRRTTRGATRDKMFPDDRDCKLDGELLKRLGMSQGRLDGKDALFFWQLLFPICSPGMNGLDDDPRMAYYEKVAQCTNVYAQGVRNMSGTRSNNFANTNAEELVRWDGIVNRNRGKAMGECWMKNAPGKYDEVVDACMTYRRWLDIKSCLKQTLYFDEKKKGDEGFDPCVKYRLLWDVGCHNMRCLVKDAGLDLTIDETTWPNASYAPVHGRLMGKKCNKGGQHVVALDTKRRYLYSWTPRHKFIQREPGWTAEGPYEIKRILDDIEPQCDGGAGNDNGDGRKIWREKPHLCFDNYFSGDKVINEIGKRGFKATMTCRRDRLPGDITKGHLHHKKQQQVTAYSRAARFEKPIVAVKVVFQDKGEEKGDERQAYVLCHVSFQSTGTTNISCVNSLHECGLYVNKRSRGRAEMKRVWAIEMNEARATYLANYSAVDKIDQALKEWHVFYQAWRWHHAPLRHGKAFFQAMSYQLYRHICEGTTRDCWRMDKPMSSKEFQERLSTQMCEYAAKRQRYPGDNKMRTSTRVPRRRRGTREERERIDNCLAIADDGRFRVSFNMYVDAKMPRRGDSRLCSDNIQLLKKHLNSYEANKTRAACLVCGNTKNWNRCMLCNAPVCWKSGSNMGSLSCSLDYHSDEFFGLCMNDRMQLFGEQRKDFRKATKREQELNAAHIRKLKRQYEDSVLDQEE